MRSCPVRQVVLKQFPEEARRFRDVAVQRLRTHERLLQDVEVQIPRANKEAARQQAEMRKQRQPPQPSLF